MTGASADVWYGRSNNDGTPDARTAYRPLSDERRAMLEAEVKAGWLRPWVFTVVPHWIIRRAGLDVCLSMAEEQMMTAANGWRPDAGSQFRSFLMEGIKRFLPHKVLRALGKPNVWRQMPETEDGEQLSSSLVDHRESAPERALRHWCSDDYSRQRRCLDWRRRVILYLRCVEGWTLEEVADTLTVLTRERVRQLEESATAKLAAFRTRDLIRKQLAGKLE